MCKDQKKTHLVAPYFFVKQKQPFLTKNIKYFLTDKETSSSKAYLSTREENFNIFKYGFDVHVNFNIKSNLIYSVITFFRLI